ncbi:hypothetical protein [Streptomyces sp. NPDC059894]|uniref:hypothetical protein n=1 Tax=unclassified Streptomyces TaxID=2593676 RepID=UPI00365E0745
MPARPRALVTAVTTALAVTCAALLAVLLPAGASHAATRAPQGVASYAVTDGPRRTLADVRITVKRGSGSGSGSGTGATGGAIGGGTGPAGSDVPVGALGAASAATVLAGAGVVFAVRRRPSGM